MNSIQIKDKSFDIFINESKILARIKEMAMQITSEMKDKNPLFIAVLNGSFMFTSDLMKELNFLCELQFIKVSSYAGTQSTGKVQEVFGLNQPIAGRNVVILEDIIDSGLTLQFLGQELQKQNPASIQICSLLLKPDALKVNLDVHFVGFEVSNEFLVGYGLDYDGLGRNLKHIYQLA
ncbi:MAG: hypoxanthine phosphoribosyltransferase [bacterium]|nr:hypoxanthine phosphoribosyltransferase [bacterium]